MVSQGTGFYIGKSCIYYLPTNNMPVSCYKAGSKKHTTELTHHGYPGNWNPTENRFLTICHPSFMGLEPWVNQHPRWLNVPTVGAGSLWPTYERA